MADETYRIVPAWPDAIVYAEGDAGDERSIRLSARSMDDPPLVCVPDASAWPAQVPPWAAERRDVVVARLRAAKCVVVEASAEGDRMLSPDGRFAVELRRHEDERTGPWESVHVIALPQGVPLLETLSQRPVTALRFPEPGIVVIALLHRDGRFRDVRVDVAARTFRIALDGPDEPLDRVTERLGWLEPAPPFRSTPQQGRSNRIAARLGGVVAWLFVAAGLWMALDAATARERWIGAAAALFFAVCAWTTRWR